MGTMRSSSRAIGSIGPLLLRLCGMSLPLWAFSPPATSPSPRADTVCTTRAQRTDPPLSGDWATAKRSLRSPDCCVVAVEGLDEPIVTLQQYFCGDGAPGADLDLRMRVRCKDADVANEDCARIYDAVMEPPPLAKDVFDLDRDRGGPSYERNNTCISALEELARGVASLADGPLEGACIDVHLRIVCASDYRAHDPMWHTDKCPLRGYVTLAGPGTQYLNETASPWDYAALRTFGAEALGREKAAGLQLAEERTFILMKGDLYEAASRDRMMGVAWSRSSSCVHRSPPASAAQSGKRVILSLDLADGKDDQEWYEVQRRRGWRSGMTQRKSSLGKGFWLRLFGREFWLTEDKSKSSSTQKDFQSLSMVYCVTNTGKSNDGASGLHSTLGIIRSSAAKSTCHEGDDPPLSLIFSSNGTLLRWPWKNKWSNRKWNEYDAQAKHFKTIFGVTPGHFVSVETKLHKMCEDNGVDYIPPTPDDSVVCTIARQSELQLAIKAAKKNKRKSRSSTETRAAALSREASAKKKRREGRVASLGNAEKAKIPRKSPKPAPFHDGQRVMYRNREGSAQATIVKVHYDDQLLPFYTISVHGREKQTDELHLSRLSDCTAEPLAPKRVNLQ